VSILVRVVRQLHEGAESITLAKVLVLPDTPTMGSRLDVLLFWEPLAAAELARAGGWEEVALK
jgi:hypothetical protein